MIILLIFSSEFDFPFNFLFLDFISLFPFAPKVNIKLSIFISFDSINSFFLFLFSICVLVFIFIFLFLFPLSLSIILLVFASWWSCLFILFSWFKLSLFISKLEKYLLLILSIYLMLYNFCSLINLFSPILLSLIWESLINCLSPPFW